MAASQSQDTHNTYLYSVKIFQPLAGTFEKQFKGYTLPQPKFCIFVFGAVDGARSRIQGPSKSYVTFNVTCGEILLAMGYKSFQ